MSIPEPTLQSGISESTVRKRAKRAGYLVRKSRRRGQLQSDDHGQFMLIEAASKRIIMGERFDAKLADINAWLTK